jgi:tRNA C32,U32 (ribose-2'-O)-methylase TrmJ
LGTTARSRGTRRERLSPRAAAPVLLEAARQSPGTPVALLFGTEDSGLPNTALDDCHALLTVPTDPTNPSLNLAQAALVVVYELWLAAQALDVTAEVAPSRPIGQPPRSGEVSTVAQAVQLLEQDAQLANGSERQYMFKALADLLWALYPDTTETRVAYSMARLRAILLRAAPRNDESRVLAHLFQHLNQAVRRKNS